MEGRLLVIGGGVMGQAIVEGGLRAGRLRAGAVVVAEPDEAKRCTFAALGCEVVSSPTDALRTDGLAGVGGLDATILLAVKPQMFPGVAEQILPALRARGDWTEGANGDGQRPGLRAISIMAGVRASTIASALGGGVRVVRAMPNTPARIGQGVTGIAPGPGATEADMASAQRLFEGVGPLVVRIDESLMDAFTALAGSGPAYAFFLAEAMERAGKEMGFDPPTARRIVAQTLQGAAALLDGADPADLRAAVTSKGGTTAAAVGVLEGERVADAWVRAILAARDRGRELAAAQALGG